MDYLLSEMMFNVIYQRITIQQIYIALCGFDCHWFFFYNFFLYYIIIFFFISYILVTLIL